MKISKTTVERLPIPEAIPGKGTIQKRYYDDNLKGFGIRTTSGGSKAFFVEKLVDGKLRRITLGRYPELTAEMARREAHKLLGKIATGIDPVAERKEKTAKQITLKEAFSDYLSARKSLKENTIIDYKRIVRKAFGDWSNKPLLDISKDIVSKRHKKLGEASHAQANLAMRILRAIFNFASGEYEDAKGKSIITENPVRRISHTKAWYKVKRKQSIIKSYELAAWYEALCEVKTEEESFRPTVVTDYILFILFTGLRRTEAASLKWEQVDLKTKTVTIYETKNHETHTLPLSDFLYNLLIELKDKHDSEYVFPGNGKTGYIVEPRKTMRKITAKSGVEFTLHDLRRTFITIAESQDIPAYALKHLLNHKMNNDVTAGYIIMDVERLRKPMQKINDFLTKTFNKDNNNIISLESTRINTNGKPF